MQLVTRIHLDIDERQTVAAGLTWLSLVPDEVIEQERAADSLVWRLFLAPSGYYKLSQEERKEAEPRRDYARPFSVIARDIAGDPINSVADVAGYDLETLQATEQALRLTIPPTCAWIEHPGQFVLHYDNSGSNPHLHLDALCKNIKERGNRVMGEVSRACMVIQQAIRLLQGLPEYLPYSEQIEGLLQELMDSPHVEATLVGPGT